MMSVDTDLSPDTDLSLSYILSLICFARMDFSEQYHIGGEAKYINDSMLIEDWVT